MNVITQNLYQIKEFDYDPESIDNFLYKFPKQDTVGISGILANKAELRRWMLEAKEKPPKKRGEYFKHQIITHRILRMFDRYFLIHEMGTGKTCSIVGFTEMISDLVASNEVPNIMKPRYKHIYILTANAVVGEIEYQIACKCSKPRTYDLESIDKLKSSSSQKAQITVQIHKRYTVTTYHKFIIELLSKMPGDKDKNKKLFVEDKITNDVLYFMAKEISDCVIWIDEVHNLRVKGEDENDRDKDRRYNILNDIFHEMRNSKLILSSATPMINKPEELGPILNLLLPYEKQIPSDFDWNNTTLEDLEYYVQGLISFVRSIQNNVNFREEGEYSISDCVKRKIPLKLYPSYMSDFQSQAYERAKQSTLEGDAVLVDERNASLFVYPDGSWGSGKSEEEKRRDRIIRKQRKEDAARKKGKITDDNRSSRKKEKEEKDEEEEDLNAQIFEVSAFSKYITKTGVDMYKSTNEFKKKINTLKKIQKLSCIFADIIKIETNSPGCGYFYINYLRGGAIPLTMCLEALGWERFYESESIFISKDEENSEGKPYCSEGINKNKKIKDKFNTPKLRYALYTGETPPSKFNYMKEAWNSYENRNGDIIKFFIVTRAGKEGISLNHVLRIHNDPSWTWSEIIQSIARALRATSYLYIKNPNVTLFRHVAVDKEGDSTGCKIYHKALEKNYNIARIFRMLKILAADCNLNKKRNVRDTDKPFSIECDHQKNCDYNCMYKTPNWIDYSISDNLYAEDFIDDITKIIKTVLLKKQAVLYNQLVNALPEKYTERELDITLTYIVNNYIIFKDKYGYDNYLRGDKDIFYLNRGFPSHNSNYYSNYYNKNIIGVKYNDNLDSIIENISTDIEKDKLQDFDVEENDIDDLTIQQQVLLFENAVLQGNKKIMKLFKDLYMKLKDDDIRIFHWIYSKDVGATKHGISAKLKKAEFRKRMLKENSDKWEDPKGEDLEYITDLIIEKMQKKEKKFEDELVIGIIENGVFKMRDRRNNPNNTGKDFVKSIPPAQIYDMMWYLNMDLPSDVRLSDLSVKEQRKELSKNKAITKMLQDTDADDDKVEYIYALFTHPGGKYKIRPKLKDYVMRELENMKLLLVK